MDKIRKTLAITTTITTGGIPHADGWTFMAHRPGKATLTVAAASLASRTAHVAEGSPAPRQEIPGTSKEQLMRLSR
jgi:hypothetical protein